MSQQATKASSKSTIGNGMRGSVGRLKDDPDQLFPLLTLLGLVIIFILAYANSLEVTMRAWTGAEYSHGYLVPLFTIVLLWIRRQPFQPVTMAERWWGIAIIAGGLGLRVLFSMWYATTLDSPTLVICLLGACVLVGGFHMLRWAGPAIAFLIFMYPLPTQVQTNVLGELQKVATAISTFMIQTLGLVATRSGNVITIEATRLNVVDACSGLRMATIFLALAVAIVLITKRPWWDRLIILLSSIPIAVAVNAIRITVTALLYSFFPDAEWVKRFSHDGAGYFMMPLALGMLYLELQILDRLVIEEKSTNVVGGFKTPKKQAPVVP